MGVIRPSSDVEGGANGYAAGGEFQPHCFYSTYSGQCYPGDWGNQGWDGMQSAQEQGDLIGMLIDLDQGSVSIWKNGERLGVMVSHGLKGPFSWAISLYPGESARIESTITPASPTKEELAVANAWEAAALLARDRAEWDYE